MSSVGIIGGVDGPVAIFVSGDPVVFAIVLLAVIVLAGAGIWLFRHTHGK